MNSIKLAIPLLVALAYAPMQASAVPVFAGLGSDLAKFSVIGAVAGATNTNSPALIVTTLSGMLGTNMTAATGITGMKNTKGTDAAVGPGVSGPVEQGTAMAMSAYSQLLAARATLDTMAAAPATTLWNMDGMTLTPGIYGVAAPAFNLSAVGLSDNAVLTLDGQNKAGAQWIFRATSTLIMGTYSQVKLINAGSDASIYWDVVSSATLGTGSRFMGNILALADITFQSDAQIVCGRALAQNSVTMISNTIGSNSCGTGGAWGTSNMDGGTAAAAAVTPTDSSAVPEPASIALVMAGLAGVGFTRRRKVAQAAA